MPDDLDVADVRHWRQDSLALGKRLGYKGERSERAARRRAIGGSRTESQVLEFTQKFGNRGGLAAGVVVLALLNGCVAAGEAATRAGLHDKQRSVSPMLIASWADFT
ncbi:MAG: hypothetical protein R6X02_19815, partial [Enhygromyxa sp.]